jgi:hypothetical protein
MFTRCALVLAAVLLGAAAAPPAHAAPPPPRYQKCADLQARYPHGVAKPGATDVVRGAAKPATKFVINKPVYLANRHLDRDKDGVACEKR